MAFYITSLILLSFFLLLLLLLLLLLSQAEQVKEDMTFSQLIASIREEDLNLELLQTWYLMDKNKGEPVFLATPPTLPQTVACSHYTSAYYIDYDSICVKNLSDLHMRVILCASQSLKFILREA